MWLGVRSGFWRIECLVYAECLVNQGVRIWFGLGWECLAFNIAINEILRVQYWVFSRQR